MLSIFQLMLDGDLFVANSFLTLEQGPMSACLMLIMKNTSGLS